MTNFVVAPGTCRSGGALRRPGRSKTAALHGNLTGFYGGDFAEVPARPPASAFVVESSPVTVRCGVKF